MTILFVTHYAGFYGANKSLLALMLLLREKYGVQPMVLLPSEGPMCAKLEKGHIPYKVSHYYWWVNYNHGLFQWILNKRKQIINWLRVGKICLLLNEKKIDLIYTNNVCVDIGLLIAKKINIPHLWQYREAFKQLGFKLSLSESISRYIWSSTNTRAHILISDYLMDYYRPYLPNDKMVRIYNGVDLPIDIPERKENILKKRIQVVCVGIIGEQKNQLELLQAQNILMQRGIYIDTYFIGTYNSDYLAKMQLYIAEHHMEESAHITGHTDNVFGALKEMNLGVVCARDEAFGRTTIEFMLMHMPVVVSDSGANPELIDEGKTGMIYTLGDVEQLADSIEHYVNHPELLQLQGDAAAKVAKEKFSAEKNAELIYEQIKNAIK